MRRCAGCRKAAPATELLRLAVGPEGRLAVDARKRLGGRGVNVHPVARCLERLPRKGRRRHGPAPDLIAVDAALRGQLARDEAEARTHGWLGTAGRPPRRNRVTDRIERVRAWLGVIAQDESSQIRRAASPEDPKARTERRG